MYNDMATMKITFCYRTGQGITIYKKVLWFGNYEKTRFTTGQGMTILIGIIILQPWKDTFYYPTG